MFGFGRNSATSAQNIASTEVVKQASADEEARRIEMQKAWRYYYGQMDRPLRTKPLQPDDNVMLNSAKLIVDKGVSFLFGNTLEYKVANAKLLRIDTVYEFDIRTGKMREKKVPVYAEDEYLKQIWARNREDSLQHRLGVNGAVSGTAYLRIKIEPNMLDAEGKVMPRIMVIAPSMVSMIWNPTDYEEVLEYRIEWNGVEPSTGRGRAYRQVISRNDEGMGWVIYDQHVDTSTGQWVTDFETQWGYSFAPIFHCQNLPNPNTLFGLSDITPDVLQLIHRRNFTLSYLARIIRYHAFPKTYATGITSMTDLQVGIDEILKLPMGSTMQNLEMLSDLTSTMETLRYLDDALFALAQIPPVALGKIDGSGVLSGVALRIHYQPLLEKTETKRILYGEMLADVNKALLAIGGFGEYGTRDVMLNWGELLPANTKEEAETGLIYDTLGISRRTIIEKLGFDADAEMADREAEDKARAEQAQTAFDAGNTPGAFPSGKPNTNTANSGNNGAGGQP